MATTGICLSAKVELLQAIHCFNATQTALAGAGVSGAFTLTGLTSTAGISVGAVASGTGIAAGAIVSRILSATSVQLDTANTGTVTSGTIAFTFDAFKLALIKVAPSLTYSATQSNYGVGSGTPTTSNIGTDEATGTGYTAGGIPLSNVTPALSSTTATTSFSPSPSLTSATISVTAGIVYNTTTRGGASAAPLNGRTIGVYDFGGTQTVTNGTITFTMPTNSAGTALIQLA
jgi:hypothetical protein